MTAVLATLPTADVSRATWERWPAGLTQPITRPAEWPALRMLLVLDNLAGHTSTALTLWLFSHGVMPLFTPVGGSWRNMAESIQRVLKGRALSGHHPADPGAIMARFTAVGDDWNADPTPFEWGGKRSARRKRERDRRHAVGGSGACTRRPLRQRNGHGQGK